jgi:hypothetical protein
MSNMSFVPNGPIFVLAALAAASSINAIVLLVMP